MIVWVLCGVCWKCHRSEEEKEDGRKKEKKMGSCGSPMSGVWKWRCGVVVCGRKKRKKRCRGRKSRKINK